MSDYSKCPFCKCYGVPKNITKTIITPIYLPPGVMGIKRIKNEVKFCVYCDVNFYYKEM